MSLSSQTSPETPADLERRLSDLANLYEVARSLLGARDPGRVASRIVLATMGTLGARSGALYRADERGRLKLACHHPPDSPSRGGESKQFHSRPLASCPSARTQLQTPSG